MLAISAAVLVFLLPAGVQSAAGEVQISEAESAAKADAGTLAQAFGREHSSTIQRCAKQAKRPDLSDFDLFLRVDATGVVDQALAEPATVIGTCVREKLPGWKLSAPPHAGFWVKVDVNLKSK